MTDDLDPYLVNLFAPDPRFNGSDGVGDHAGMGDIVIPITNQQLAEEAGRWFHGVSLPEVPAKLWLDMYAATGQIYLRATFDKGGRTTRAMLRLQGLAVSLDLRYGTELITVAYTNDMDWDAIEALSLILNRVV
jgi:hypothetical protein